MLGRRTTPSRSFRVPTTRASRRSSQACIRQLTSLSSDADVANLRGGGCSRMTVYKPATCVADPSCTSNQRAPCYRMCLVFIPWGLHAPRAPPFPVLCTFRAPWRFHRAVRWCAGAGPSPPSKSAA
eukprot:334528-Chlamydomonas_euryale.AAC.1